MSEEFLMPTPEEIRRWFLATLSHVLDIEYYLTRLQVGTEDPQRPHDIVGEGNKLEWEAIRHFALQFRPDIHPRVLYDRVGQGLVFHRQQYHHQMWNGGGNPNVPDDAMKLGAVDAICSLLESEGREYQGGAHDFEQIASMIAENPEHKRGWMRFMLPEMAKMERPRIELASVLHFRNPGIPTDHFNIIRDRAHDVFVMLVRDHGIPNMALLVPPA